MLSSCFRCSIGCQCLPRVLIPLKHPWVIIIYILLEVHQTWLFWFLCPHTSQFFQQNHSITEAGGHLHSSLVQLPDQSRSRWVKLLSDTSSWIFKSSNKGDDEDSLGDLCLTVLISRSFSLYLIMISHVATWHLLPPVLLLYTSKESVSFLYPLVRQL